MIGERTRTVIIAVVTAVWAINFLAGLVIGDYKPSESINGIFMGIVGGLFALGGVKGGDGKGTEPPTETTPAKDPEAAP